jgi:parvulin-like peptidyl-prolyl isomerase
MPEFDGQPRSNLPEPLSGVPEQPLIELGAGYPWLTLSEINRLIRVQSVAPLLIRAWVLDELARAIPLTRERERQLEGQWLEQHGIQADQDLEPWLRRQRLLRADVLQMATQAERLDRFRRHRWSEEVAIHFLRRKPELDQAMYRLLRVSDQALAEELHQRLQEGEASFAELASLYSEGQERHNGGLIGPLQIMAAHGEIASRLRLSRPGQLWPPFQADRFWVFIQLDQHLPAKLDEATAGRMLDELFEAWIGERVQLIVHAQPLPALPPLPTATEEIPNSPP